MRSITHASPHHRPVWCQGIRAGLVLTCLLLPALALAHPGDLDPHFGSGGKVRTGFGTDQIGSAVALLKGGKILVAGVAEDARGAAASGLALDTSGRILLAGAIFSDLDGDPPLIALARCLGK